MDNGAGDIPSAPELVKFVWERVTFQMNAFGLVDSRAASPVDSWAANPAITRILAQGTRGSRFWPLCGIVAPEDGVAVRNGEVR